MNSICNWRALVAILAAIVLTCSAFFCDCPAQEPPYDVVPEAEPPYYRVRYPASDKAGELIFPVKYTVWIPPQVKSLRGVIVHQHGCGEGSCKSGLTGAFDLHWQTLAKKHDCALLAPSYEQPQKADCQMWCDPRNGSDQSFQKSLVDLGEASGHSELASVPWALWGHSGGGHWCGGMTLLHPDRVAAAWLRSGVPLLEPNPERPSIKPHQVSDAVLSVPIMCNPGTKEGVTVKDGRFASVWPANESFFHGVRGRGGLIGISVDPLTAHECGNQRYMAIPWLDACLEARLPAKEGDALQKLPTADAWLAPINGSVAVAETQFDGDPKQAIWLLNESVAKRWMQYVKDTNVADETPPPSPTNVRIRDNQLSWEAEADLESGLARFIIQRDGEFVADYPSKSKNPFGRPIFQGLQYSDTPKQPLVKMRFQIPGTPSSKSNGNSAGSSAAKNGETSSQNRYRVIAVNTLGLKSKPSEEAVEEQ